MKEVVMRVGGTRPEYVREFSGSWPGKRPLA